MVLEELQRRNYAQRTAESYLRAVEGFAKHFHRAPQQLTQDHIREYQAYLFRERKLSSRSASQHVAALRFFYVKTLKRSYLPDEIPFSETTAPTADHSQSGRSDAADRLRRESAPPGRAHDAVFDRHTARRTGQAQGQ
jgi:site-specific recombinase XerD